MGQEFKSFAPEAIVRSLKDETELLDLRTPLHLGKGLTREEVELRKELYNATIAVAKVAKVYKIPNDKLDITLRNSDAGYYRIDSGMNINVPQGRIKALRFFFSLYGDGRQSDDVWVLDGFPKDKIDRVNIISGKVKVGINSLLKIVPFTQPFADLVDVDINPWEFDWGYDKLQIGFTENLTYNVDWYLSGDNVNQSFNCYLTIRKKSTVKHVYAAAKAIWEYEPQSRGLITWIKNRFGKGEVAIKGEQQSIGIIKT
jgi:hypothetical protein